MSGSVSQVCGYTTLPEPDLVFAGNNTHKHPLIGLKRTVPTALSSARRVLAVRAAG